MTDNSIKIAEKAEELEKLVDIYGSQSKQIKDSFLKLNNAVDEVKKAASSVRNNMTDVVVKSSEATNRYNDVLSKIGRISNDCETALNNINNTLNEENFKEICSILSNLVKILEECKALRDDLTEMKTDIVEELSKTVELEMSAVRTQQAENRAFMEAKFTELFEKLNPTTNITPCDDTNV